jgi:hypothetical protein
MNKISALLIFLFSMPFLLHGQTSTEKKQLPEGPLLAEPAPKFSAWAISYTYSTPEPNSEKMTEYWKAKAKEDPEVAKMMSKNPSILATRARVVRINVVKTGDIKSEISTLSSGAKGDRWLKNRLTIKRDAVTKKISLALLAEEVNELDFAELAWISPKNFKEIKKVEGRSCLVFSDMIPLLQLDDARLFQQIGGGGEDEVLVTAVVDMATRLPVSLEYEACTRIYTFGEVPTQPQALPPDLETELKRYEKRSQDRNASMSVP